MNFGFSVIARTFADVDYFIIGHLGNNTAHNLPECVENIDWYCRHSQTPKGAKYGAFIANSVKSVVIDARNCGVQTAVVIDLREAVIVQAWVETYAVNGYI